MIKTLTIAGATAKEALRQPAFFLLFFLAAALLFIFPLVPYNTFGEDVKMVKDTGLQTILVAGLLMALLTASSSVHDEIEGRTAITLLSKPINRRQFIVGKFLGIVGSVAVMFVGLSIVFAAVVYYKVGYDARESARMAPAISERINEVWQVAPGLILALFEVAVLSAISVALSTRLPMLPNLIVCLSLFVLGHLTPVLVQVSEESFEAVGFMASLFSTIVPQLYLLNIQENITTGTPIPVIYLIGSFAYCVFYCSLAILLAFLMFEDRDLA
jgi:ABC-type transport system involved in multi-copper enzyme maturation permease subunit